MRRSKFYNMRLPERGAREGEANDAADIEDLTYDLGIIDAEMERQRLEDVRLEKDKATKLEMSQHKSAAVLDHPDGSVTDAKLGQRTVLTTSGTLQTLLTAIGNAIKAISGADTWNGTPATTLKDAKTHMGDAVKHITAQEREIWNAAATDRHSHTNKSVLDSITAAMVTAWNTVSSKLPLAGGTLTGFLTLHAAPATDMHAATKKYVDDKMAASGSGDMTKAVYDPGGRELPYIPKQDVDALAWGGDFGASGTPASIAYAGANRIDALTLYGENVQGGTTEAPVALTGITSVTVNDDVTELPIPRPLHKVGDVRDVCRTRVKSVYDKRIVLDGSESWTEYNDENWKGGGYHVYRFHDADAVIGQPIASNKYPSRMGSNNFKGTLGVATGGQSILFSVIEQKTVDDWKAYLAAQKAAGTPLIIYRQSTAYDGTNGLDVCLTEYQTGYIESYADESITTAWISSTGALSTGAEVAYVLSSPETYATDPLDIDNAAGPLTVMTGGEVEVRMTELIGSRSPEFAGKMDKATYDADGDGVVDRANSVDGGTY